MAAPTIGAGFSAHFEQGALCQYHCRIRVPIYNVHPPCGSLRVAKQYLIRFIMGLSYQSLLSDPEVVYNLAIIMQAGAQCT